MQTEQATKISQENSEKLDKLLNKISELETYLLSLKEITLRHEEVIYGKDGKFGLIHQMRVVRAWT
jgi:hypothetical protein